MIKVQLVGNLTADPELQKTPNDVSVARFDVAVNRSYSNADGERDTDFFHVTVWRGLADSCAKCLKKGNKVFVAGTIQNRSYDDKDGIKRYVTDVIAEDVEFLTPKSVNDAKAPAGADKYDKPASTSQITEITESQLPFD